MILKERTGVRTLVKWTHIVRTGLLVLFMVGGMGCGLAPRPRGLELSQGRANWGNLVRGRSLPDRGAGYVRARAGEPTRWGTQSLVGLLRRAAAQVERDFPGAAPLRIGDLSSRFGGKHPRHGSHRTGRDADILFYLTDARGHSTRGRGWLRFDERGLSAENVAPEGMEPSGDLYFFDTARNWHFVRTLLTDPEVPVQWLFCSAGVKARLLLYAAAHEPDPDVLVRAANVLHQPSRGNPHADHFHLRLACSDRQRALGCLDVGPSWPWLREPHEKAEWTPDSLDDETLVRALLEDEQSG